MFETIILIDGCKFTGIFKDKKRNGFGIKYYTNGATYEGIYVDDKRHGKGIKTTKGGIKEEVEYINGILINEKN